MIPSFPPTQSDLRHTAVHDQLNGAFDNGSVFTDSTEQLQKYLMALGTLAILNPPVKTKAIIRALVINNIQISRLMASFEQRNRSTQFWFMILAIGSIIVGGIAAIAQIAGVVLQLVALNHKGL